MPETAPGLRGNSMDCETCVFYVYDEFADCYDCLASMDEDDAVRMMESRKAQCPYYRLDDEYGVVRHQM